MVYYKLSSGCVNNAKKMAESVEKRDKTYAVGVSQQLGRYLIATKDLKPGDEILADTAIVFGPNVFGVKRGNKEIFCVGCCKRLFVAEKLTFCEDCHWPACSSTCEGLKDPSRHAIECFLLKFRPACTETGVNEFYRSDILIALRTLCLQKTDRKKWEMVMDMEAHPEKRGPNTEAYKYIDKNCVQYITQNFLQPLKTVETEASQKQLYYVTPEIIHKIYGVLDVNAFQVTDEDLELKVLYPNASLMEHDCVPNTYSSTMPGDHYGMLVKASVPIAKGEHITTIYTDALLGTQQRRKELRKKKYFDCTCQRCRDPTEFGTYLSALKCWGNENQPCGGNQLPVNPCDPKGEWKCDRCPVALRSEQVKVLIEQIGHKVEKVLSSKPDIKELEELEANLLQFLHPNHFHVFSVKHSMVRLYGRSDVYEISPELLKKKLTICEQLLEITKQIDPGKVRLGLQNGILMYEMYFAKHLMLVRVLSECPLEDISMRVNECKRILDEAIFLIGSHLPKQHVQGLMCLMTEDKNCFEHKFTVSSSDY